MKTVIFLGPSLPLREATGILDAIYLPPAQQTDLLTATVNHRPDVIGLVDGVFMRSLSVWHKEILHALNQGIRVYGASSMGALRAAETDAFGMIGVGEIYRQYASGELMDDDEVALAHGSAETGYQRLSEPMVNVRATLVAAERAGVIDKEQCYRLVAVAKSIYFAERTFPVILQAARAEGMSLRVLDELSRFFVASYVDLKRRDAIELLQTINQFSRDSAEVRTRSTVDTFTFKRTTPFETLYNRDRRVEHNSVSLPLESISNYVALHDRGFDELNFNALNRAVVFAFGEMLGLEVPADGLQAECARFRKRTDLVEDEAFVSWLEMNHLSHDEFVALMSQVGLCRRLHRWFVTAMWMTRTSKVILDELRLKNGYVAWVARAAAQERILESNLEQDGHGGMSRATLQELLDEHRTCTECVIDMDAAAWAEEAGFHTEGNLKMEVTRASAARRVLLELLASSALEESGSAERRPPTPLEPGGDPRRYP